MKTNEDRSHLPALGIVAKAEDGTEIDINHLDRDSFFAWLGVEKWDQKPNKVIGLLCALMGYGSPWEGFTFEREDSPFEPPEHDEPRRRDLYGAMTYEWARQLALALEDFDGVDGAIAEMVTVKLEIRNSTRRAIACARQHILKAYDIISENRD